MSFFKKIFVVLAMMGVLIPSFALAANEDDPYGFKGASDKTGLINTQAGTPNLTVPELIGSIVGVALQFLGAIFFLLILYAGFLWMTAFGSSEKADKAKSILEHAAVGLIIVLAAYAISRFVFTALGVGESGGSSQTADIMGCCRNSATNGFVQTLQSNCSSAPDNPRTWEAGDC